MTQPAVVHYSLSRPASISAWLADARGARLPLRDGQARPAGQDYQLAFDGTYTPASTFVTVGSGQTWRDVVAGSGHACAIETDASVW